MSARARIWVLCTGEPLPTDPGTARLHRAGLLSAHLAAQGHQVTFWTGNFDHFTKRHRMDTTACVDQPIAPNYQIRLIPSRGYARNVSLARIMDHRDVARNFLSEAEKEPRPDGLVVAMPTIDLAHAGARFAKSHGIPYIIDLRDLWPEIFYLDRPAPLRQAIHLATTGMSRQLNWALRNATAVVGITPAFMEWGCKRAGRTPRPGLDQDLPLGYPTPGPASEANARIQESMIAAGDLRPGLFQICFLGAISDRMDLATLCQGVKRANETGEHPVHLVLAGDGAPLGDLRQRFQSEHIRFLGRVDQPTLGAILRSSRLGVVPYRNSLDFVMSIPNKAIEYLAHGLPILTCLRGTLASLVEGQGVGLLYGEGQPESLVQALAPHRSDPGGLAPLSERALTTFKGGYSAESVLARYESLILRLVRG